jgi:hypothetical protein
MYGHDVGGAALFAMSPGRIPIDIPQPVSKQNLELSLLTFELSLLTLVIAIPKEHDMTNLVTDVEGITIKASATPCLELFLKNANGMVNFITEYSMGYVFPGYNDIPINNKDVVDNPEMLDTPDKDKNLDKYVMLVKMRHIQCWSRRRTPSQYRLLQTLRWQRWKELCRGVNFV